MALTISDLSKTYPNGVRALQNVSLTIGNHMFGLLGPNGAGRSTLMRTIATLQDPDSGSIQLDGLDVLAQKNEVPSSGAIFRRSSASIPSFPPSTCCITWPCSRGLRPQAREGRWWTPCCSRPTSGTSARRPCPHIRAA